MFLIDRDLLRKTENFNKNFNDDHLLPIEGYKFLNWVEWYTKSFVHVYYNFCPNLKIGLGKILPKKK